MDDLCTFRLEFAALDDLCTFALLLLQHLHLCPFALLRFAALYFCTVEFAVTPLSSLHFWIAIVETVLVVLPPFG